VRADVCVIVLEEAQTPESPSRHMKRIKQVFNV